MQDVNLCQAIGQLCKWAKWALVAAPIWKLHNIASALQESYRKAFVHVCTTLAQVLAAIDHALQVSDVILVEMICEEA